MQLVGEKISIPERHFRFLTGFETHSVTPEVVKKIREEAFGRIRRRKDAKTASTRSRRVMEVRRLEPVGKGFGYSEFVMPVAWDDQEPEKAI